MDVGALAKGALIGALVGGAFNGMRQFQSKKTDRAPLPARHENLSLIDDDLLTLLYEVNEMAMVPPSAKPEFVRHLTNALKSAEHLAAIEVQIENHEIVPGFHDANEASRLAERTVLELRQNEQLFEQLEMRTQYRDKVTELQSRLGMHLNNINSECLQY